jgi:hypothetical protein
MTRDCKNPASCSAKVALWSHLDFEHLDGLPCLVLSLLEVDPFGFLMMQESSRGTAFFEQQDMYEMSLERCLIIEMGGEEGGEEESAALLFLAMGEWFMSEREKTDEICNLPGFTFLSTWHQPPPRA